MHTTTDTTAMDRSLADDRRRLAAWRADNWIDIVRIISGIRQTEVAPRVA